MLDGADHALWPVAMEQSGCIVPVKQVNVNQSSTRCLQACLYRQRTMIAEKT
jgi:hypothetical protein